MKELNQDRVGYLFHRTYERRKKSRSSHSNCRSTGVWREIQARDGIGNRAFKPRTQFAMHTSIMINKTTAGGDGQRQLTNENFNIKREIS